jgi:hypothetical protein
MSNVVSFEILYSLKVEEGEYSAVKGIFIFFILILKKSTRLIEKSASLYAELV